MPTIRGKHVELDRPMQLLLDALWLLQDLRAEYHGMGHQLLFTSFPTEEVERRRRIWRLAQVAHRRFIRRQMIVDPERAKRYHGPFGI